MLSVGTLQVFAQKVLRLNRLIDSVLTTRYNRVDLDTNYVTRPQTKWTLIGRYNMSGTRIKTKGNDDSRHFESEFQANYKSTISASVSYMGLSLSLALQFTHLPALAKMTFCPLATRNGVSAPTLDSDYN